jgi:hypothetical protein
MISKVDERITIYNKIRQLFNDYPDLTVEDHVLDSMTPGSDYWLETLANYSTCSLSVESKSTKSGFEMTVHFKKELLYVSADCGYYVIGTPIPLTAEAIQCRLPLLVTGLTGIVS